MAEGGPRIIRQRKNGGTLQLIYLRPPQPFQPITVQYYHISTIVHIRTCTLLGFFLRMYSIKYMIFQSSCSIIDNISILARAHLNYQNVKI